MYLWSCRLTLSKEVQLGWWGFLTIYREHILSMSCIPGPPVLIRYIVYLSTTMISLVEADGYEAQ